MHVQPLLDVSTPLGSVSVLPTINHIYTRIYTPYIYRVLMFDVYLQPTMNLTEAKGRHIDTRHWTLDTT